MTPPPPAFRSSPYNDDIHSIITVFIIKKTPKVAYLWNWCKKDTSYSKHKTAEKYWRPIKIWIWTIFFFILVNKPFHMISYIIVDFVVNYHGWLVYNLLILILLFQGLTNTTLINVQSILSVIDLLNTICPLYLVPLLPRALSTQQRWVYPLCLWKIIRSCNLFFTN